MLQVAGGGIVVGAGAVGAWQWLAPEAKQAGPKGASARNAKVAASESFVHVIAHPDDSLYFMNPELEQSIRSGAPSVTVCLTGGESDGRNALSNTRDYRKLPERRPEFVRARLNGFREATARMATGDSLSPWEVETLTLLPGFEVEVQTLRAAPQVQLIFLELIEARTLRNPRKESLRGLWLGAVPNLTTLKPAATPVTRTFRYGRQELIDTLVAVFERYQPTVVRTLDPNPTHEPKQRHFPNTPPVLEGISKYDHQDHTTSAFFAQAALAEYWGRKHSRPTAVESYIGYEVSQLPSNLDRATTDHKVKFLDTYGWADGKDCGDSAGCGDRKVGARSKAVRWSNNCRHRAPGTTRWVQPLPDKRLAAFALLDGAAHCWTETKPGSGVWSSAAPVAGPMLEGQVQAVRHTDGTLQLFSVRTVLPGKEKGDRTHRREVVTTRQTGMSSGTPTFGAWEPLGSPETEDRRSMEMGYPVAAVGKDGTVHVFVRTFDGGVAFRGGAGGKDWTEWETLPSPGPEPRTIDGLDAAADEQGRIHVLIADTRTVHHWMSQEPGGTPRPAEPTRLPTCTGPVTLAALPSGGMRVAMRQPDTSRVIVADRPENGSWKVSAQCEPLGGYERVGIAQAGNTTVLADRDSKGRVRLAAGSGRPGSWQDQGIPYRGTPGMVQDAEGRVVTVVLGMDGKLSSARQRGAGAGAFTAWAAHDGRTQGDVAS